MNKNRFTFGAVVLAAGILGGAVACSSSGGGGGGSVTGTIGGGTVKITDSVSVKATGSGSDTSSEGEIIMSNIGGLCAEATSNSTAQHKNASFVFIQVANVDATSGAPSAPTAPGTFTIFVNDGQTPPPAAAALMDVFADDATCMSDAAHSSSAMSGTVTLTAVSGNVFTGSYDVTLASGDHITGKFSPEACAALNNTGSDTGSGSGSAPVCE